MQDHPDFFAAVAALGRVEELDLDSLRLLYRVECCGEEFYNQVADRIASSEARELLYRNAREERGHAERVRRVISLKQGTIYEPSGKDLESYPIPLPDALSVEFLPVIVQGEADGQRGYDSWADRETHPEVQRLLRLNAKEEGLHGERVKQVIAILTSPR
jgi:rubrerythrin